MLPITIPLLPDESVDSWLETLAHLNYCTPRDIVSQSNLKNGGAAANLTRSLRIETALTLEEISGTSHHMIMNATLDRYRDIGLRPRFGQRLAEGTWASNPGTRFCPECLRERDLRWKINWHLSWQTVCNTHQCLLQDRCPVCGRIPRDSGRPHPRGPQDLFGSSRAEHCSAACRTDVLASSPTQPIPNSSTLLSAERTLSRVLASGNAALHYTGGVAIPARHFFSDLTLLTKSALTAIKAGDVDSDSIEQSGLQTHDLDLEISDRFSPALRSQIRYIDQPPAAAMAIATTLALAVLDDPRTQAPDAYPREGHWLTAQRIKVITDRIRAFQNSFHSRYIERLVSKPHAPKTSSTMSDSHGHRRTLHSVSALTRARPQTIDAIALPSCLWPEAVQQAPPMPARVARTFPYLAPIALATIGRKPDLRNLAGQFGLEDDERSIRSALNNLVSNEMGTETFEYLVTLHEHLLNSPAPIDYRRRRRLFPTPNNLGGGNQKGLGPIRLRRLARAGNVYKTEAFTWKINRYVWQLLTGYDPFITQAAQLLHGPAAYQYREFVHKMHPDLQQAAGEVAEQLLRRNRIGEPVAYDLSWSPSTQTWSSEIRPAYFLEPTARTDLRRYSLSIQLAASTAGDAEELIHLALAGEHHLALRIYRFVLTQHLSGTEGRIALGISSGQISREVFRIEEALGEQIFTRNGSQSRKLTDAGRELAAVARPYLADLQRVAGPQALPPDMSLLEPPPVKRR